MAAIPQLGLLVLVGESGDVIYLRVLPRASPKFRFKLSRLHIFKKIDGIKQVKLRWGHPLRRSPTKA